MEGNCFFCQKNVPWEEKLPAALRRLERAEALTKTAWGLCVLNREGAARVQKAAVALRCRTLLLPEECPLQEVETEQVVSYGLSGKNSLTLSSMREQLLMSVQRELTRLDGSVVERQEILLPESLTHYPQEGVLALVGAWLLL